MVDSTSSYTNDLSLYQSPMLVASKAMALTAIDLMSNPLLIQKATQELKSSIGDYKYKALLGDIKPALNYRD